MRARTSTWWEEAVQNRLIALVLAIIVLVPLVTTPLGGAYRNVDALAVEGFTILLLCALLWRVKWNINHETVKTFFRTGANLPILLFVGLGLVSWIWSANRTFSAQETMRLASGVILYLVVAYQFRRSEYLSKLVDALLFVSIAVSLYGFVQYSQAAHNFAVGPFGDHQLYGSFLMILLPIVATIAITEQQSNRQLFAQCATVLLAANLLISHSRTAWIGAAVGLTCLLLLGLLGARRNLTQNFAQRKHQFIMPILLIVFAVGFFLLLSPQTSSILERATSISNFKSDKAVVYREGAWAGALKMIKVHPLTGAGIGQYPYLQSEYTGLGTALSHMRVGPRPSLSEAAHNFYLQTTAELGVPGLLLFLGILITFFVNGIMRFKDMEPGVRRHLLMGSMASVAAFAVDAFGSPSWQVGQVSLFFWLAMGIGVACQLPKAKGRAERERTLPNVAPIWSRSGAILAGLMFAALLPTVVASAGPGYNTVVSVDIEPKNASIVGGQTQQYTLFVTFQDPGGNQTTVDVSTDANTTFSKDPNSAGDLVGPNNRIYQSRFREMDTAFITGTYVFNGTPYSDTTSLTVHFP